MELLGVNHASKASENWPELPHFIPMIKLEETKNVVTQNIWFW
jgi:hypothetical protein